MTSDEPHDSSRALERLLQEQESSQYVLRLYVAGNTVKSAEAILNLRKVCEERLQGRYQLEVVDISQNPGSARRDQIVATPTLIKYLPVPIRRIIGDLSKTERLLVGLDLQKLDA